MVQKLDIKQLINSATEYDKEQMFEECKPESRLKGVIALANSEVGVPIFGVAGYGEVVGPNNSQL